MIRSSRLVASPVRGLGVRARAFLACCIVVASLAVAVPARAALTPPERGLLVRYLDALVRGDYAAAFALLSDDERRYFRSAANYGSVFAADRVKVDAFRVLGSTRTAKGTVALVSERIEFFDHARQSPGTATVKVPYGLVPRGAGLGIKDPYHPWRAYAPSGVAVTVHRIRAIVRKVSFFTGRLEIVATFQNLGDTPVTILAYGRTALRDETGKSYPLIASNLSSLTDKTLYTGLRLPGSGEYTGALTFQTPDRFTPKTLTLTVAPALLDGGDEPFQLPLPTYVLPT
jgi:hypothetical protein